MLRIITLISVVIVAHGLTDDEIAQITSKGMTEGFVEQNTGLTGEVSITEVKRRTGTFLTLTSNGIPDHDTGTFPAVSNPNTMTEQSFSYTFPKDATLADTSTCLPMGPIAFARNGIPMFSPRDATGENAVEGTGAEVFDSCEGHPTDSGIYHYHQAPGCLIDGSSDQFIGVALDGFPIYGPYDENGNELTVSDLDICHGRTGSDGNYRYHITYDYPYILGCFSGKPYVKTDDSNCKDAWKDTDTWEECKENPYPEGETCSYYVYEEKI